VRAGANESLRVLGRLSGLAGGSISADGRFVAFGSFAPLVVGDPTRSSAVDIFLRGPLHGETSDRATFLAA
jgi:hypothetical protein